MKPIAKSVLSSGGYSGPWLTKKFDQKKSHHFSNKEWIEVNTSPTYLSEQQEKFLESKSNNISTQEIDLAKNQIAQDMFDIAHSIVNKREEQYAANVIISGNLSFAISKEQIMEFTNQLMRILRDPQKVASYLQPLDQELGEILSRETEIIFPDETPYEYLIEGAGNFLPGPPKKDYRPFRKQKILDKILLEREQQHGINKHGVATFVGIVDSPSADKFVAKGNLFKDDVQIGAEILHGKNSHRLMFEIIRQAFKKGDLELKIDGRDITQKELLELFVKTGISYDYKIPGDSHNHQLSLNLWNFMIDLISDSEINGSVSALNNQDKHFDPNYYTHSSRSPYILNSLLLCFGNELGLKNLQHYLLDSFYKEMRQITQRIKDKYPDKEFNDEYLYNYCILQLSLSRQNSRFIPSVGVSDQIEFMSTFEERRERSKIFPGEHQYQISSKPDSICEDPIGERSESGRKRRKESGYEEDSTESWEEYMKRKKTLEEERRKESNFRIPKV